MDSVTKASTFIDHLNDRSVVFNSRRYNGMVLEHERTLGANVIYIAEIKNQSDLEIEQDVLCFLA